MQNPTFLVIVDGYRFGTEDKSAIAYLFQNAKSTMTVSEWDDPHGDYVPVPQSEFSKW